MDGGTYCIAFFINVFVGFLIGCAKNDIVRGVVWAIVLGPVGWVITLLVPATPSRKTEMEDSAESGKNSARGDKSPTKARQPAKQLSENELCYQCGKVLGPDELKSRVCRSCQT